MSELSRKLGLDQIPLDELVKRAHNEISALCHRKQWRMTIPVQPDDSDIVLSEALQAQEKTIARLRAENAGLKARVQEASTRWISIFDQRPENMCRVMTFGAYDAQAICWYRNGRFINCYDTTLDMSGVTHWKTIDEPETAR